MKKINFIIALLILTSFSTLFSQENVNADSIAKAHQWKPTGVTGANINQVYFKDWTQGGENSIAWNIYLNLGLDKEWTNWKLKNSLKAIYGMMKMGENDFRSNENEFYLENILSYKLKWKLVPYFSNTVRTILFDSYDYKDSNVPMVATFFDPAYITQAIGFLYDNNAGFTTRIGVAFNEIITNRFRQYTNNGDKNGTETFKFESGFESVTAFKKQIFENIIYDGRLRLFTRFNSLDVVDVRYDHTIAAKINKYVNVNFTAIIIHEIAQSRRTQFKEGLQIGLSYILF